MKYEAIEEFSSRFPGGKMCKVFGLDSANYHRWKRDKIKRIEKHKKELELIKQVKRVFEENNKVYGYRSMKRALEKEGIKIIEYKVRKIMIQ